MLEALGLLVLTGALWGCTNPFIRRGTKGLRDVRATSLVGQAWAELTFLLGNWQYVVPWLVNQCGSLSYLLAVQRAPLSLAVPAANGLAFAATAVVGAATGDEEPLDTGYWLFLWPCVTMQNQCGSLSYLLAVQRAPLSLAVPAANGLAFAATAVVGAATGDEEPLDTGSIIGVALIVLGTALCCMDKTS